ncbi:zincin [Karstenula rhodostoma CBS 690.94]|uniref:Zincin n=1 Tax=Karstenula rhodostoma CBS 690.94 TaxID=1392251 RepID=A0A9P4UEQ3_9PLEO|nr:zincin [Karstenula rhodostoma CBS 690.94]
MDKHLIYLHYSVAHELAHGLLLEHLGFRTGAGSADEPTALWEHMADVVAIMYKHWAARNSTSASDWVVADKIFKATHVSAACRGSRDMKNPGTAWAYIHPTKGLISDKAAAHISQLAGSEPLTYYNMSTIPSRAFAEAVDLSGQPSYGLMGEIWWRTIMGLQKDKDSSINFKGFAKKTMETAQEYKTDNTIKQAWAKVGISIL